MQPSFRWNIPSPARGHLLKEEAFRQFRNNSTRCRTIPVALAYPGGLVTDGWIQL